MHCLDMPDQKRAKAKTAKFLHAHIPNMTKIVADIFDDFRTVYDRRLSMHAGVKWYVSNKTITTAMLYYNSIYDT
jgi:hypothetical protein